MQHNITLKLIQEYKKWRPKTENKITIALQKGNKLEIKNEDIKKLNK